MRFVLDEGRDMWAKAILWLCFLVLSAYTPLALVDYNTSNPHSLANHTTPIPSIRNFESIQQTGELRVAIDNTPVSYYLQNGTPQGFEYEIVNDLAQQLQLKLKIVRVNTVSEAEMLLKNQEVDLIAISMLPTKERRATYSFTVPILKSEQVLLQQKLSTKNNGITKIADIYQLDQKKIHVIKDSRQAIRLQHLREETGVDFEIVELNKDWKQDHLISLLNNGAIDYTICDKHIAKLYSHYYPNLDASTTISLPQQYTFALRKNTPKLLSAINTQLQKNSKNGKTRLSYLKYFSKRKAIKEQLHRFNQVDYTLQISKYDQTIKNQNQTLQWDWRLIAAQIYHESNFSPHATSCMGAKGLMQIMPATADMYKIKDVSNPANNIYIGMKFLNYLDRFWMNKIPDPKERKLFVLASYNAGPGHVLDAQRLTIKNGGNPLKWKNQVEKHLLLKKQTKYYKDPVCRYGYCNGTEPVNYVEKIMDTYSRYTELVPL